MAKSNQITSWPLSMPRKSIEHRFTARIRKHGELVIVPKAELKMLMTLANAKARQLQLPFDSVSAHAEDLK